MIESALGHVIGHYHVLLDRPRVVSSRAIKWPDIPQVRAEDARQAADVARRERLMLATWPHWNPTPTRARR